MQTILRINNQINTYKPQFGDSYTHQREGETEKDEGSGERGRREVRRRGRGKHISGAYCIASSPAACRGITYFLVPGLCAPGDVYSSH